MCVLLGKEGEVVIEKCAGEPTAEELKLHWNEVSKGVLKELLSLIELSLRFRRKEPLEIS